MTINSPYHDVTVTVSLFVFSPPSRQQETEQRGEEQEGGGAGAGELTHSGVEALVAQRGTESSGALLNISSI